ncbi:O-antigen ligase family protein [Acaryochloris marina]|uniref:O-antigen ligase family protein n=1 Tax=Acaryochloris marina TaxID=155978 RepID=UPI0021C45950|nr:O-antigen ligase family protein [Acaryochloris marina]BDM79456.1 hypothetical protein AM10699_23240 [Acaryochloris marina MBIC10699]
MTIFELNKKSISFGLLSLSIALGTAMLGEVTLKASILLVIIAILLSFFLKEFEVSILFLLVLRSSLDFFSQAKIPAAYGVGIEMLAVIYMVFCFISNKSIQTDSFWWLLFGWTISQGLWLLLMPLDALGSDASYLAESVREWLRILIWPTAYFLVLQLKGKVSPQKILSVLLLALPIPILMALFQLQNGIERINSTFAHSNAFASFLLLFMGIVWWQYKNSSKFKGLWITLLGGLSFLLISTKALFVLVMLLVSLLVVILPKLNLKTLIFGILSFSLVISLFASTDYGRSRLESTINTPLLNPEISINRGILLSESDHNSFNWRLSHWHTVLKAWEKHSFLGYGLGLSKQSIDSKYLPHNDYLRALIEGGILGLFSYLVLWGIYLTQSIKLVRTSTLDSHKDLSLIITALIIAVLVGMLTENIWSHTVFFFYFSILFAISSWDWNSPEIVSLTN